MLTTKAALRGSELRQELKLRGRVEAEEVAEALGLTVVELCLPRVDEFIAEGMVAISDHLSRAGARLAMGHAIGHHQLHQGNYLWLRAKTLLAVADERQAEDFAYGLLVDEEEAAERGI